MKGKNFCNLHFRKVYLFTMKILKGWKPQSSPLPGCCPVVVLLSETEWFTQSLRKRTKKCKTVKIVIYKWNRGFLICYLGCVYFWIVETSRNNFNWHHQRTYLLTFKYFLKKLHEPFIARQLMRLEWHRWQKVEKFSTFFYGAAIWSRCLRLCQTTGTGNSAFKTSMRVTMTKGNNSNLIIVV